MAPPESSQNNSQDQQASASTSSSAGANSEVQSAYNDLRRLIPMLASELDQLRAALREHNLWLQRYGHSAAAPAPSEDPFTAQPPAPDSAPLREGAAPRMAAQPPGVPGAATHNATTPATTSETTSSTSTSQPTSTSASSTTIAREPSATRPLAPAPEPADLPGYSELPGYSASDVPPYTGGPNSVSMASTSTREQVEQRRDELTQWLAEGEDTLREYSARFAQLGEELHISPPEDVLGTWNEASPDNALPDYAQIETREELMVGGVGEVPPPYVRGQVLEKAAG